MNQNPWHVENMAQYERERIRQEIEQIRLGERARMARAQHPRSVARLWLLVRRWFGVQREREVGAFKRRPTAAKNARGEIRV